MNLCVDIASLEAHLQVQLKASSSACRSVRECSAGARYASANFCTAVMLYSLLASEPRFPTLLHIAPMPGQGAVVKYTGSQSWSPSSMCLASANCTACGSIPFYAATGLKALLYCSLLVPTLSQAPLLTLQQPLLTLAMLPACKQCRTKLSALICPVEQALAVLLVMSTALQAYKTVQALQPSLSTTRLR